MSKKKTVSTWGVQQKVSLAAFLSQTSVAAVATQNEIIPVRVYCLILISYILL